MDYYIFMRERKMKITFKDINYKFVYKIACVGYF